MSQPRPEVFETTYRAKRDREEPCKDIELENSNSTIGSLPPSKRFAGSFRFPVTQDLNFEQIGSDITTISLDSGHENFSERFPEYTGVSTNEFPQMKNKEPLSEFDKKSHLKPDAARIKNPKKSNSPISLETSFAKNNDEGCSTYEQRYHDLPLKVADLPSNSTCGKQLSPSHKLVDQTSEEHCDPSFKIVTPSPHKENTSNLKMQKTKFAAKTQQDLPHASSTVILTSSSKTPKLSDNPKIPTQYIGTHLQAINENEVFEHRLVPEIDCNSLKLQRKNDASSTQVTQTPEMKGPVVPYEKMPIAENAMLDAELELCGQWLNKDRSTTLEQLQDRLEKAKSKESMLCRELEQMLVQTKDILDSELDFSVKLCSIRGQCLLFQETIRSDKRTSFSSDLHP